jgi:CheY-like chemotaxis protein
VAQFGLKAELRDLETIRAYLDELARLKAPIQLWAPNGDDAPFVTRVERLSGNTFITSQTPPLIVGAILKFAFLLDARRFTAATEVMGTGIFRIPSSIAQGERREHLRAAFGRADKAEVFAVEEAIGTVLAGRTLMGRILDMGAGGLRVLLEEVASASGPRPPLKAGDRFGSLAISGLPYTPAIQCRGVVAHISTVAEGRVAGLRLEGVGELDQRNLERVLEPRMPATYGQAFTKKKRKTDIADQVGAPTATPVVAKVPEVVALPVRAADPEPGEPERPELSGIMKLRKLARRILVISAIDGPGTLLAQELRVDGFRQVFEARSFVEAQVQAKRQNFDLLLLDLRIGGHSGQEMVEALRKNQMLVDTPVILVADLRSGNAQMAGEALGAVHIHGRSETYEELVPVLYALLLQGR